MSFGAIELRTISKENSSSIENRLSPPSPITEIAKKTIQKYPLNSDYYSSYACRKRFIAKVLPDATPGKFSSSSE